MELVEGINKTHLALPVKRKKEIGGCHDFKDPCLRKMFSQIDMRNQILKIT